VVRKFQRSVAGVKIVQSSAKAVRKVQSSAKVVRKVQCQEVCKDNCSTWQSAVLEGQGSDKNHGST
jgi:hypothetical protein